MLPPQYTVRLGPRHAGELGGPRNVTGELAQPGEQPLELRLFTGGRTRSARLSNGRKRAITEPLRQVLEAEPAIATMQHSQGPGGQIELAHIPGPVVEAQPLRKSGLDFQVIA